MPSEIITIWDRWTKYQQKDKVWYDWEFNHISDGYDPNVLKPIGKFDHQTAGWKNGTWRATEARLVDGVVKLVDQL